jgi:hypothetical protein
MAWACRDSDRRVMARTHTEMASHLRSDRRRAGTGDLDTIRLAFSGEHAAEVSSAHEEGI